MQDVEFTTEGVSFTSVEGHKGTLTPSRARALAIEILVRWPDPSVHGQDPRLVVSDTRKLAELVDAAVRPLLIRLRAALETRHPEMKGGQGLSSGGDILGFHYLEMHWPGSPEPLIIGVHVTRGTASGGFVVTADVCGEDSGRVHIQELSDMLPREVDAFVVAARARELLSSLCDRIIASWIFQGPLPQTAP